jgi:3',5'-nucleoside bisphosphate phosphatase
MHTTASDGRSRPVELIEEAAAAGLTTIAVTDHDTLAALPEVAAAARARGIETSPGIEITAVHSGRDVHILAYFVSSGNEELSVFLERQRADRLRRLFEMLERLDRTGVPVDREAVRGRAAGVGRSAGRPLLAEALVRAGHVGSIAEAFERYLGQGRPAFVPRHGATPREVIELIGRANGLTSLAHPGKLHDDELIPGMVEAGLPAIEVQHPDHDAGDVARYRKMAERFGLLVTGGSDYHGPGSGRAAALGNVTLAPEDFERLTARAALQNR